MKRLVITCLILILGGLSVPVFNQTVRSVWLNHQLSSSPPSYSPQPVPKLTGPTRTDVLPAGTSAYAIDVTTMTPLYAQDATTQRPIASVTKLMALLVVLSDHHVTDKVTVGKLPAYDPADERLGLTTGQTFSVGDLAQAALIASDNDAADALALYDAGSLEAFTTKMNRLLQRYGISGAHFTSATGLTDQNNYASAQALAKIAKLALVNPTIKQDVGITTSTISDGVGHTYRLTTTDDLLLNNQFHGIKTGYTDAAGQCFVGLTIVNGHEVITVVLHSGNRFGDTQTLINWIQGAWKWQ